MSIAATEALVLENVPLPDISDKISSLINHSVTKTLLRTWRILRLNILICHKITLSMNPKNTRQRNKVTWTNPTITKANLRSTSTNQIILPHLASHHKNIMAKCQNIQSNLSLINRIFLVAAKLQVIVLDPWARQLCKVQMPPIMFIENVLPPLVESHRLTASIKIFLDCILLPLRW